MTTLMQMLAYKNWDEGDKAVEERGRGSRRVHAAAQHVEGVGSEPVLSLSRVLQHDHTARPASRSALYLRNGT
jgi:hypothetical protein